MSETRSTSTSTRAPALPGVDAVRAPQGTLPLLRDLVHAHTGMFYDEARLSFLQDRLAPLATERGFDSLLDYYYLLKYDEQAPQEWARAIDALSVQETYFWRESDQLTALVDGIMPRLVEQGVSPVRIWSIPCATGEEPLSIAMALEEAGWFSRARIEIHASDASEAALRKAAANRYGQRAFRQLPEALREKYFDAHPGENQWSVRPGLRARVSSWTRMNLVQAAERAALAGSHVIFCRNLFIYFTEAGVREVVNALADAMPSPGYLCVGASESLLRVTSRFDLRDVAGAYVYVKP